MKGNIKRQISLVLSLIVMITSFIFIPESSIKVQAAQKPGFYTSVKSEWCYANKTYENYLHYLTDLQDGDKVQVTSSKKNIVRVLGASTSGMVHLKFGRTAGTTVLKCKVTRGNKVYNSQLKLTTYKYSNPFKKCKIGNKDYSKIFNKDDNGQMHYAINKNTDKNEPILTGKKKISVTLADTKKFQLVNIQIFNLDSQFVKFVKNGASVNMSKVGHITYKFADAKDKNKTVFVVLWNTWDRSDS